MYYNKSFFRTTVKSKQSTNKTAEKLQARIDVIEIYFTEH